MTNEEVNQMFSNKEKLMAAADADLDDALISLAARTSIDNDVVIKASIISSTKAQRHIDKIEGRNQAYTAAVGHDGARKELLSRWVSAPTSSGAPTARR
jgi:hypothetical protein